MYDILIVGSGPAGMTAAIYGARANLKVAIIEKSAPGGAMVNTSKIENYPGYTNTDGAELSMNMFTQIMNLGVDYHGYDVLDIKKENGIFKVITNGETLVSKTIIIATGTSRKKLNVKNEDRFSGHGISWCAICDGNFYRDKVVMVIGGGNSALEEAVYLATVAKKVYVVHRHNEFTADSIIVKEIKEKENVTFILDTIVKEFVGNEKLEKAILVNIETGKEEYVEVDGCFEYIGQEPASKLVEGLEVVDEDGYIVVNQNFETKVNGLFAAGDIIKKEVRQIVTAVNDGAIAALNASRYCK